MTQLLPKVAAIKEALGIPPDLAALQALETACELLGIVPDPASTLMQMADNLVAAIGCVVAQSPVPAPTPAPTPALTPTTAHTPAHAPVNAPAASPATSRKRPDQRPAPQDSASYNDGLTGSLYIDGARSIVNFKVFYDLDQETANETVPAGRLWRLRGRLVGAVGGVHCGL